MKLCVKLFRGLASLVFVLAFPEEDRKFTVYAPFALGGSVIVVGDSALGLDLVGPEAGLAEQAVTHGI